MVITIIHIRLDRGFAFETVGIFPKLLVNSMHVVDSGGEHPVVKKKYAPIPFMMLELLRRNVLRRPRFNPIGKQTVHR